MIRKALIVLLTLGALVFAMMWTATAWWSVEYVYRTRNCTQIVVSLEAGRIHAFRWPTAVRLVPDVGWNVPPRHTGIEFSLPNWGVKRLSIPLCVPLVLFAAYPTIAFIRGPVRRWRRRRKGLCLACGYDLTGNVSGVCPECGTEIKKP